MFVPLTMLLCCTCLLHLPVHVSVGICRKEIAVSSGFHFSTDCINALGLQFITEGIFTMSSWRAHIFRQQHIRLFRADRESVIGLFFNHYEPAEKENTHTPQHTHARTHTHAHTHTHHTRARARAHTHTHTYTHIRAHLSRWSTEAAVAASPRLVNVGGAGTWSWPYLAAFDLHGQDPLRTCPRQPPPPCRHRSVGCTQQLEIISRSSKVFHPTTLKTWQHYHTN